MAAIDRAIDNRLEDLITELDNAISELRHVREEVLEEYFPENPGFDTSKVQKLYWEWHTLMEHKRYGCGSQLCAPAEITSRCTCSSQPGQASVSMSTVTARNTRLAMSHSKGFLSGTCPGNFRKKGRPHEVNGQMVQQWACGRCGRVKNKRAPKCLMFHDYRNSGQGSHGFQKQKCTRCGNKRSVRISGCGIIRRCQWHKCDKAPGLHCKRCNRQIG